MTSRRPITFFLPALDPGGAERKTVVLANGFAARGHAVDICTAYRADGLLRAEVHPSVRVVALEIGRSHYFSVPVWRYLRRTRPHVLVCVMNHTAVFGILGNLASFTRTPIVIIEGGLNLTIWEHTDRRRYILTRTLIALLYPLARRVFVNSAPIAAEFVRHARLPAEHIEVIPNPSAVAVLEDEGAKCPMSDFPNGDAPVVISVGRIDDNKDVATLLRAFALARARRALTLAIVGEGPERGNLEALAVELGIENDVRFLGARSRPWRYVRRAAVFVNASRTEGFSNALVEAMAVGCPVVATNGPGGTAYILEDGRHGELVPVGDAASMARGIERMLDTPTDSAQLIARARDFSEGQVDAYLKAIAKFAHEAVVSFDPLGDGAAKPIAAR
jgi:glycosyltransferase involved in cell wall biosynthesis